MAITDVGSTSLSFLDTPVGIQVKKITDTSADWPRDDQGTAEAKVAEVSTEVAAYLYAYVLGNKGPLIDGINNSSLPFMDATAKTYLINQLSL